ncbi:DEAD/DEAH box helicase [Neobacillus massiliamazoniensis]|jgi:ATP-dependent RNA helicase DeaD|uniref:ATP-dependent RNA helicase CshA n=1 Tax=Neobacillus massiliamazoniensis TaxID=1499688 RepID=A0A0U1NY11_9BACI|nr:DEAD/DEAH box helicase [Neobacillus massiliamazoniensis]CRK82897.1 DEAD/DEAH box helicase [Neobacillus massiliamazoniensis]
MTTFHEMGISEPIQRAITDMGFEEASPIQEKAIPMALTGKDIIGQAQTGTGKTAAFAIPILEKVDTSKKYVQAIAIAPTRELAIQVSEEINRLAKYVGISSLPIYGGQSIDRQIKALKKVPHIITGTPGRLLDHIQRKTLKLDRISVVVLDEADEMLDMGFLEDIERILKETPEEKQTLLFSATMPKPIQNLAERFMNDPELVKIKAKEVTSPSVKQIFYEVNERDKFEVLCRLLDVDNPELAVIFGRTKRRVDELSDALNKRGYLADGLHGDLNQRQRDVVMNKFREGNIDILVATDVAARGIDVSGVTHVYNFDIPQDPESYVHRIGRTGRAGKTGLAITFATPRETGQIHSIEKASKGKIQRKSIPTVAEARESIQRAATEKMIQLVEKEEYKQFKQAASELLEQYDSIALVSIALKLLSKEQRDVPVQLTSETPRYANKPKIKAQEKTRRNYKGNREFAGKGAIGKQRSSRKKKGL